MSQSFSSFVLAKAPFGVLLLFSHLVECVIAIIDCLWIAPRFNLIMRWKREILSFSFALQKFFPPDVYFSRLNHGEGPSPKSANTLFWQHLDQEGFIYILKGLKTPTAFKGKTKLIQVWNVGLYGLLKGWCDASVERMWLVLDLWPLAINPVKQACYRSGPCPPGRIPAPSIYV